MIFEFFDFPQILSLFDLKNGQIEKNGYLEILKAKMSKWKKITNTCFYKTCMLSKSVGEEKSMSFEQFLRELYYMII